MINSKRTQGSWSRTRRLLALALFLATTITAALVLFPAPLRHSSETNVAPARSHPEDPEPRVSYHPDDIGREQGSAPAGDAVPGVTVRISGLPSTPKEWLQVSMESGQRIVSSRFVATLQTPVSAFLEVSNQHHAAHVVVGPSSIEIDGAAVSVLPTCTSPFDLPADASKALAVSFAPPLRILLPQRAAPSAGNVIVTSDDGDTFRVPAGTRGGADIYGVVANTCYLGYEPAWPPAGPIDLLGEDGSARVALSVAAEQILHFPKTCLEPLFLQGREELPIRYDVGLVGAAPKNTRVSPVIASDRIPATVEHLVLHTDIGSFQVPWRSSVRDSRLVVMVEGTGSLRVTAPLGTGWNMALVNDDQPWPAWPESAIPATVDGADRLFPKLVAGNYRVMAYHQTEGAYFHPDTVEVSVNRETRLAIPAVPSRLTILPSFSWDSLPPERRPHSIAWNHRVARIDPVDGRASLRAGGMVLGASTTMELGYGRMMGGFSSVRVVVTREGEAILGMYEVPAEPSGRLSIQLPWAEAEPVVKVSRQRAGWNGWIADRVDASDGTFPMASGVGQSNCLVTIEALVPGTDTLAFIGWVAGHEVTGETHRRFEGRWAQFTLPGVGWSIGFEPPSSLALRGTVPVHWMHLAPGGRVWIPAQCERLQLCSPSERLTFIPTETVGTDWAMPAAAVKR